MKRRSFLFGGSALCVAGPVAAEVAPAFARPTVPVPSITVQWSSGNGRWHDVITVPTDRGSFAFTFPKAGVYTVRLKSSA